MRAWSVRVLAVMAFLLAGFKPGSGQSAAVRDCRAEGVTLDGVQDDCPALNRCIAKAASGDGPAHIQLGCGQLQCNTPIDNTNHGALTIEGCGGNISYPGDQGSNQVFSNVTVIKCNTGGVCADNTGSPNIRWRNIGFRVASWYKNPSRIALLFGRDNANPPKIGPNPYCFPEWDALERVFVFMDSDRSATPVGRIAIADVAAEQFTILGGYFVADTPAYFNNTNALQFASPYQKFLTGCAISMTEVKIGQGAGFQAWTGAAFNLTNVLDFETEANTEMLNGAGGTNHNAAFLLNGVSKNMFLRGQVESFDMGISLTGKTHDHVNAEFMLVSPATGAVAIDKGVAVTNSRFSIAQQEGAPVAFCASCGPGSSIKGSVINLGTLGSMGPTAANLAVTQSDIFATGFRSSAVNFAQGSHYMLHSEDGIRMSGASGGSYEAAATSPRSTFGVDLIGQNANTSAAWKRFTPDTAIVITRIDVELTGSRAAGCKTSPLIRVTDGSNNSDVALENGVGTFSKALNNSYAAGTSLSIQTVAGNGCSQNPTGPTVTVQYKMQ